MGTSIVPPSGHRFVSLAEAPWLWEPIGEHNGAVWPEFMQHDAVVDRLWEHLRTTFPGYQAALVDERELIAATMMSAPLWWDGTDAGLPDGWDDQFERTVADALAARPPNTLGALLIVVAPTARGRGLAELMLEAMRSTARAQGFGALMACVRPTRKADFPLIPIEDYARWTRADGLPFDPWIRQHVRVGGRIVRAAPTSMTMTGSVAEWREWTGLELPFSGAYVVPGATNPVEIDVQGDLGVYHDANVWVVHDLRVATD